MQPIKELLSVAGLCAGRGCALIRQLANCQCHTTVLLQITEAGVDSSQVKRECYIAYNIASESKKKIPSKPVFIKAPRWARHLDVLSLGYSQSCAVWSVIMLGKGTPPLSGTKPDCSVSPPLILHFNHWWGVALLGPVHFLSPDQQSRIHCLIVSTIQLLTLNNWRHICLTDI